MGRLMSKKFLLTLGLSGFASHASAGVCFRSFVVQMNGWYYHNVQYEKNTQNPANSCSYIMVKCTVMQPMGSADPLCEAGGTCVPSGLPDGCEFVGHIPTPSPTPSPTPTPNPTPSPSPMVDYNYESNHSNLE